MNAREQIVQILWNYESELSDGYKHYCGYSSNGEETPNLGEMVEAKLDEIAEKILGAVLPMTEKRLCEMYGLNIKGHEPWEAF